MHSDLVVGGDVSLYGRTIHLVDCDEFTKTYLEDAGIQVSLPESYPTDPIDTYKATYKKKLTGKNPNPLRYYNKAFPHTHTVNEGIQEYICDL